MKSLSKTILLSGVGLMLLDQAVGQNNFFGDNPFGGAQQPLANPGSGSGSQNAYQGNNFFGDNPFAPPVGQNTGNTGSSQQSGNQGGTGGSQGNPSAGNNQGNNGGNPSGGSQGNPNGSQGTSQGNQGNTGTPPGAPQTGNQGSSQSGANQGTAGTSQGGYPGGIGQGSNSGSQGGAQGSANQGNTGGGPASNNPTCSCNQTPEVAILADQPGCPAVRASDVASADGITINPNLICPNNEGEIYQTDDGAMFRVKCCAHGPGDTIDIVQANDFRHCMRLCSRTDDCHSVDYTAQDKGNEPVGRCELQRKGGFATADCGAFDQHNYAYVIDPPEVEAEEDVISIRCSTECPYGHGQLFTSDTGEIFQLTCGKRQGTKVIHQDVRDDMMDCMQACANVVQCNSVDYDIHRNICYYTTHKNDPSINATRFASARSLGCGGVCGTKEGKCGCSA